MSYEEYYARAFATHKKRKTKSKATRQPTCLSGDAACAARSKPKSSGLQPVGKPTSTKPTAHPLSHIIPGMGTIHATAPKTSHPSNVIQGLKSGASGFHPGVNPSGIHPGSAVHPLSHIVPGLSNKQNTVKASGHIPVNPVNSNPGSTLENQIITKYANDRAQLQIDLANHPHLGDAVVEATGKTIDQILAGHPASLTVKPHSQTDFVPKSIPGLNAPPITQPNVPLRGGKFYTGGQQPPGTENSFSPSAGNNTLPSPQSTTQSGTFTPVDFTIPDANAQPFSNVTVGVHGTPRNIPVSQLQNKALYQKLYRQQQYSKPVPGFKTKVFPPAVVTDPFSTPEQTLQEQKIAQQDISSRKTFGGPPSKPVTRGRMIDSGVVGGMMQPGNQRVKTKASRNQTQTDSGVNILTANPQPPGIWKAIIDGIKAFLEGPKPIEIG